MAIQRVTGRLEPVDVLTAREREVLGLLAAGITCDRELCARLSITQNTIKYHIRNILSKLGQRNRAQLVAHALGHRLVDVSPTQPGGLPSGEASRGAVTAVHTGAAPGARPRVLVADDDEAMLDLMAGLLGEEGGYEVLAHRLDGDIHTQVARELPDLVILDLLDGGRREAGWRALELLRLDPATRHIPVMLCSAAADRLEGHREWAGKLGVDLLAKPFDVDDLLARVRAALGAEPVVASA